MFAVVGRFVQQSGVKAAVLAATGALGVAGAATYSNTVSDGINTIGQATLNAASGLFTTGHASADALHAAAYPWNHRLPWQSFDHMSIRRGFKVYQNVCASCHSLNFVAYRNLVDVAYTEEEVKAMAADVDIEDGPNDAGDMYTRPGKLADHIPPPYPNEQAARAANNGAYPVDLSLIVKARPGAEDYLFSLLTGYREAPAGVDVKPGMSYNPYFNGGQIAMGQQLTNDMLEYEDGTDASASQLAKDVTTFLSWAAEPHQDEHKKMGVKAFFLLSLLATQVIYWKRFKWSIIKNRRLTFL